MQGSEMKELREQMGLSQGKLAAELEMTQTFISLMENGKEPIARRTELAVRALFVDKAPLYDTQPRPAEEGDVPLAIAQVIWDPGSRPLPPVKVVGIPGDDDNRYICSAGACSSPWGIADTPWRLLKLFALFQELTTLHGIPARAVHDAFWVIPEYRRATAYDFVLQRENGPKVPV